MKRQKSSEEEQFGGDVKRLKTGEVPRSVPDLEPEAVPGP